MGISKIRNTTRVTLNVGGDIVQLFAPVDSASNVLNAQIDKAVETGLFRRAVWGAGETPSVRALLRKDGSPVGISYISKGIRAGVQAAIYEKGNKSKRVRFVSVKARSELKLAFLQCVIFLSDEWQLNAKQTATLERSFADFLARIDAE